jgi:hypothetical protein
LQSAASPIDLSDRKKRRTGSTGGYLLKHRDHQIRSEAYEWLALSVSSVSPSLPADGASGLKNIEPAPNRMMQTLKQIMPGDILNNTTIPVESKLIDLPNVVKFA